MKKFLLTIFVFIFVLPLFTYISTGSKDDSTEVDIYLISNAIHVGVAFPRYNDVFDWNSFLPVETFGPDTLNSGLVEFGWGDRRFYFEMPTWDHFTLGLAADALFWPDPAVMHVEFLKYDPSPLELHIRKVSISKKTYKKLAETVKNWFVLKNGKPILIQGKGYGPADNFFEAYGSYSIIKTCNVWTADIFADAGLRHPLWSPLKYGMENIYEDN